MNNRKSQTAVSGILSRRNALLGTLGLFGLALAVPFDARAEEHSGGSGGHSGGSGGHSGGGESGGGGHSGGGGEGGNGNGSGRTAGQRARRHRQRTGRTLGGGETGGGYHGGHAGTGDEHTLPLDGSTTGPIGGATGGEHFVHSSPGCWGADCKVLNRR